MKNTRNPAFIVSCELHMVKSLRTSVSTMRGTGDECGDLAVGGLLHCAPAEVTARCRDTAGLCCRNKVSPGHSVHVVSQLDAAQSALHTAHGTREGQAARVSMCLCTFWTKLTCLPGSFG